MAKPKPQAEKSEGLLETVKHLFDSDDAEIQENESNA